MLKSNKTFDHFLLLDSQLQNERYSIIVDAIRKEGAVDADRNSGTMDWLQFLLPNLIQQHQKCIRLMELGTLET